MSNVLNKFIECPRKRVESVKLCFQEHRFWSRVLEKQVSKKVRRTDGRGIKIENRDVCLNVVLDLGERSRGTELTGEGKKAIGSRINRKQWGFI